MITPQDQNKELAEGIIDGINKLQEREDIISAIVGRGGVVIEISPKYPLSQLRSAIIELAMATYPIGKAGAFNLERLGEDIAWALDGETDPNQIAQRITDVLKETEARLGIQLTKGNL